MRLSEFKAGTILVDGDDKVFIHDGFINADGYGVIIGEDSDGMIQKSNGIGNWMKEGFVDCAKWVQKEFLKDLWHPASEEPKRHSYIMFKTTNNNGFGTEYIDCSWKAIARCLQITQWLYIDDLLPKKGGDGK